ncbi:hypothetical protein [Phytoactinopolyspora endophytica]|uniref:hypothetical protein n=1 Tax=Phytoactinopolyspora endophytica TaxID=1642495 RepID=UPI00101C200C|nr:hypothetical protein [Phytoactinopolyspora endophytica]
MMGERDDRSWADDVDGPDAQPDHQGHGSTRHPRGRSRAGMGHDRSSEFELVIDALQGIAVFILAIVLTVALLGRDHGFEILVSIALVLLWWPVVLVHSRRFSWAGHIVAAACVLSLLIGLGIFFLGALWQTRLIVLAPILVAVLIAARSRWPAESAPSTQSPDDEFIPDTPRSINLSVWLMLAAAGLEIVRLVLLVVGRDGTDDVVRAFYTAFGGDLVDGGSGRLLTNGFRMLVVAAVVMAAAWLWLSWAGSRGYRWAGDVPVALSTIYVLSLAPMIFLGDVRAPLAFGGLAVVQAGLAVTVAVQLHTSEARHYISVVSRMT